VLVVGIGNSAVDIAVDLCRRARSVTLSTRRSAWIMPKYLMGIPVDRWSRFFVKRLHFSSRLTRLIMSRLIRLGVGDQRRFGLPRPEHPMWREHATLSQELLPYIGHGWISIKPNVAHFNGHEVQFDGGHSQRFDAIIHATGYRPSFPFLSSDHFPPLTGPRHLYRRMHYASRPGLYFAGLVQPVGPTITLVEIQGRWMAAVLAGKVALPDRLAQEREIERHRERQRRTYLESARYDLEVDFPTYAKQLLSDMNSGQAGI
jgi:cation diffusion facilitator CzcD-associated flavoprotein CzcO